jgi:hypothetical protein
MSIEKSLEEAIAFTGLDCLARIILALGAASFMTALSSYSSSSP